MKIIFGYHLQKNLMFHTLTESGIEMVSFADIQLLSSLSTWDLQLGTNYGFGVVKIEFHIDIKEIQDRKMIEGISLISYKHVNMLSRHIIMVSVDIVNI